MGYACVPRAAASLLAILLLGGCANTFYENPVVIPERASAVSGPAEVYLIVPGRTLLPEIRQQYAGSGFAATGYDNRTRVGGASANPSPIASIVDAINLRTAAKRATLVVAAVPDRDFRSDFIDALSHSRLPAEGFQVSRQRLLTRTPTVADVERIRRAHPGKPVVFIHASLGLRPELRRLASATELVYYPPSGEWPALRTMIRFESAAPGAECGNGDDWRANGANWIADGGRKYRLAYRAAIDSSIRVLEMALLEQRDWRQAKPLSEFRSQFDIDINRMHRIKGVVVEESEARTVVLEESGDFYVYGRGEVGYETLAKRAPLGSGQGRLVFYRPFDEGRVPVYLQAGKHVSAPICNGFFTYLDLPPGEYPLSTGTNGGFLAGQWVGKDLGSVRIEAGKTRFVRARFAFDSWSGLKPSLETAETPRSARGLLQAQAHSALLGGEPEPFAETAADEPPELTPLPREPLVSDSRSYFAGVAQRDLPAAMERAVTDFLAEFSKAGPDEILGFYAPEYRYGEEDTDSVSYHWNNRFVSPVGDDHNTETKVNILKIERDGFDPIVSYTAQGLPHARAEQVRLVYRGARWLWYGDTQR